MERNPLIPFSVRETQLRHIPCCATQISPAQDSSIAKLSPLISLHTHWTYPLPRLLRNGAPTSDARRRNELN
nr:hypothetical protein Q903MT_gene2945 [Picea sitchensis]